MCRALRRAAGVLLATGVLGLARPASAQHFLERLRERTPPVQRAGYGPSALRSEGQGRLEEMKAELALLSDAVTFPYYLSARAAGCVLEVRGYVPSDAVKQHALEIARHNSTLSVTDGLRLQANLNPHRPLRGAEEVLREGNELLAHELGNAARQLHLDARPNGVVRITGSIDSVQEKLAVSRLFRQVSGCAAVVNLLAVRPVLHDGQRVMQVTRDGSQTAPPAALPDQAPVDHPLEARAEELHLPSFGAARPRGDRPATSATSRAYDVGVPAEPAEEHESSRAAIRPVKASKADEAAPESDPAPAATDALTRPSLPASWSRPRFNPQARHVSIPPPPPLPAAFAPPAETPKPAPAQRTILSTSTDSAASEPPSQPTPPTEPAPEAKSDRAPAPVGPPIRSARRWPPAFDVRPPEPRGGHTGMIIFDDEPTSAPAAPVAAAGASYPVTSAELQKQIKSVFGRKARDVKVEVQPDGSLLVKAKAPSSAAERELTGKILTIPAMTAPNVHLAVEVSP
jgi:hypothetical protein